MRSVDKLRECKVVLIRDGKSVDPAELADEIEREVDECYEPKPVQHELLPCPFCGGEAELSEHGLLFIARCADGWCIGGGVSATYTDAESAVKAWNTRAVML